MAKFGTMRGRGAAGGEGSDRGSNRSLGVGRTYGARPLRRHHGVRRRRRSWAGGGGRTLDAATTHSSWVTANASISGALGERTANVSAGLLPLLGGAAARDAYCASHHRSPARFRPSDGTDVLRLQTAIGLLRCELHLLALLERLEARALDVLVVDEQLVATVIRGDESPTLLGIEKLHGAGRHVPEPLSRPGFG